MARNRRRRSGGNVGSVSVGGNAVASALSAGDRNVQTVTYNEPVPPAIVDALHHIRTALDALSAPHSKSAKAHANKAIRAASVKKPDKDKVGDALKSALKVAKKSTEFAGAAAKLAPYLKTVADWLGGQWSHLSGRLG